MASPEPKDPRIGRMIAQRYRLISRLGSGAVATVYLARHVLIDRLSAIKVVHPGIAEDPLWRERFLREARAVNRINHPNIVEITDLGETDGLLYLVMEYVPGESLDHMVERGPLGWRRAATIGQQIAAALGRAHEMGVVHRSLDASSVLVVPRRDGADLAKLTDFGVAKLADAAPLTVRVSSAVDAPRERDLPDRDARSDLHDLGVVIYLAAAGGPPANPPARIADAPDFFQEVLSTLMAKNPEDRPRDGFEAADLLRRVLESEAPRSLPPPSIAPPSMPRSAPGASWLPILESSTPARPGESAPVSSERPAPRGLAGAPIDRLATTCAAALEALEDRIFGRSLSDETRAAIAEAERLTITVETVHELVQSDLRALNAVEARSREQLTELGRSLDEAAREHSRTLGWAGTIAERTYEVEVQRFSGEHAVPVVEAMVWEQAALEQEEDRARDRAARLDAQMRAYKEDIRRKSERREHERLVVNACLEGRVAALRSLAAEAWATLESAAALAGIGELPRETLPPPAEILRRAERR